MAKKKYIFSEVNSVDTPNFTMNPANLSEYFPKLNKFETKRFYWVSNVKGKKETGQHAHKDEDGLFIVVSGKAVMILDDDGKGKKEFEVSNNSIVWVPRYVWHGFKSMSNNYIVLILSNKSYDSKRKGYIESYQEFVRIMKDK